MLLIFESKKGAVYVHNGSTTIRIRRGWFNDAEKSTEVIGFDKKVMEFVYKSNLSTFKCSDCKYHVLLKQ